MSILHLALRAASEGTDSPAMTELQKRVSTGSRPYIVAVDFDGTLCEDSWPDIGEENRVLLDIIPMLQKLGVLVVLWTCREGEALEAAEDWCGRRGVRFDAVNENCGCIVELFRWNTRKIHADEYWDDRAVSICFNPKEEIS